MEADARKAGRLHEGTADTWLSRKAACPGVVHSGQAAKLHARLDLSTIPSCNGFAFSQVLPFGIAAWQWIERMP
jgi:hypothetical protein